MERPTGTRLADCLVPVAVSLAAFALVITFFAPRLVLWSWTDLESAESHPPDFNRAIDTLRQLDNPFVTITNPTNRHINWRLLFPIVGHYLHLPRAIFLALPVLGCLFVLGYVAHLVRRESGTWWAALAASALLGTTSWFFVSTGWLAYFDSWYVLGLLVAAFGRSKIATGLACLLTPWVDERFVLTLPLLLVIRGISTSGSRAWFSEGLRFFSFVAPYCALRLLALATAEDEGSAVYLRGHLSTVHHIREIAFGFWSGLRAVWVFVVAAPILLVSKRRAAGAALLALAVAVTFVANVPLAHDFSRSASTLLPAALLGIILLVRVQPRLASWLIGAALAFNLLTPAQHVIETWDEPIRIYPLYYEVKRFYHPPANLASLHLIRAGEIATRGKLSSALSEVEIALRIDPTRVTSQLSRGMLLNDLGRVDEAAASYDAAVRLAPRRADVYIFRARFLRARGQIAAAERDLRTALELTPEGTSDRAIVLRELAEFRQTTKGAP